MKKCLAFTLAEVLITLGIIGVVAAMTIPTLMNNHQKQTWVNQLKKSMSLISQGFRLYMVQEGVNTLDDLIDLGLADSEAWNDYLEQTMPKVFKVIRICKNGDVACHNAVYTALNKTDIGTVYGPEDTFIMYLADGSAINIRPGGETRSVNSNQPFTRVFMVGVDVNGDKGPNIRGRDYFVLRVSNLGQVFPYVSRQFSQFNLGNLTSYGYWRNRTKFCGTPNSKVIASDTDGSGCAARIMENGWVMDY